MPDDVRAEIARARTGKGPAAAWLVARGRGWGQVGTSTVFLRENKLAPALVGWLAGIAMFGDDTDRLADVLEGHPAAGHALAAFAAGIAAGVTAAPGQWPRIERLVAFGHPPTLAAVLPLGVASTDRDTRLAATRIARKLGTAARDALDAARAAERGTSRRRLTAANATLAKNADDERGALLLRLLDGWRATRSDDLEAGITILGAELARVRGGALAARTREQVEDDWEALAKRRDARDVDRLLLTSWPKSLDHARRRVDLLAKFPPDPRILRGIAAAATRHRSSSSLRFHRSVAKLFGESPVAWLAPAIDAIIKAHDDEHIVDTYDAALAVARTSRSSPPPSTLLADARRLHAARTDLDALWQTHLEPPADLAHRAVLADALQAAGDPRGEFITLQLQPDPDPATRKRIATLLAAHADAWTGPIPLVSRSTRVFQHGFLAKLSTRGSGRELTASYDRPEWVTIEDLFIDGANTVLAQIVRRMPLLRRLATPHAPLLAALARTGTYPSIEALACNAPYLAPRDRFPNLRVMAARFADNAAPFNPATFERAQTDAAAANLLALVHLGLAVDHLALALDGVRHGPPETRFAIGGDFAGFDTDGWRIRASRKRRVAALAWGGGPSALKQQHAQVIAALTRVGFDVREVKRIDLGAPTDE